MIRKILTKQIGNRNINTIRKNTRRLKGKLNSWVKKINLSVNIDVPGSPITIAKLSNNALFRLG